MQHIMLRDFDQNPSTITLNYKSVREYRSSLGGTLSILYFLLAITFIGFKIIFLVQRGDVTFKQIVTKQNDLSALNFTSDGFKMCFYEPYMCDPKIQSTCQPYQNNLFGFFIMYNNNISLEAKKHQDTLNKSALRRSFQTTIQLKSNSQITMLLQLKKTIIQTDNSIFPQIAHLQNKQISIDWLYDEQITQHYSISTSNRTLFVVNLQRSVYTHIYKRSYPRLDTVLAEIFGMLGFITIIIFGLYKGYNSYGFQQKIRKSLKLQYERPTICRYYRYLCRKFAYQWCECCFKNSQNYLKQKHAMEMISRKLDTSKFQAVEFEQTDTEGQFIGSFYSGNPSHTLQNRESDILLRRQNNNLNKSVSAFF